MTVAFRHGYGASFLTADSALEYADAEMQRLLAACERLECEDFAGIYCEAGAEQEIWHLDRREHGPAWKAVDDPNSVLLQLGPMRQDGSFNLVADLRRRRR